MRSALVVGTVGLGVPALAQAPSAPAKGASKAGTTKSAPAKSAAKSTGEPAAKSAPLTPTSKEFSFGRFGKVAVLRPAAGGAPKSVVLFLSGDGGWNAGVVDMAKSLTQQGALVLGVNTPHYIHSLNGKSEKCAYPAGDLEALSQFAQKRLGLPDYLHPVMVGYSSGATLAYAAMVQAPAGTFQGAMSLGFCPDLDMALPFCKGSGLTRKRTPNGRGDLVDPVKSLSAPWYVLGGTIDQACPLPAVQKFADGMENAHVVALDKVGHGYSRPKNWMPQFVQSFEAVATPPPPTVTPPPPEQPQGSIPSVEGLPLVEVPAANADKDTFALLISGDGGWAGIDRELAAALNAQGLSVLGWDSLRYFWHERTPEETAKDVERAIAHYQAVWKKPKVVLVGYSRGADVLPAVTARLSPEARANVRVMAMVAPGTDAVFEIHVTDFIADSEDENAKPILPEVQKLGDLPVVCVYGDSEEDESLCPKLKDNPKAKVVKLPGGHHFGGDYAAVARAVTSAL